MTNPYRTLLTEMAAELDWSQQRLMDNRKATHPLADRARVLLDQHPQPVAVSKPMPLQELAAILHEAAPDLDVLYSPCPSSEDLAADLLADPRLCISRANALPTPAPEVTNG